MGKYKLISKGQRRRGSKHGCGCAGLDVDHDLDGEVKLWSMYVNETTVHDKAMLKDWNDCLDVLLIVAGLFSAVVTTIVFESYPLLQSDPQQNVITLLAYVAQQLDSVLPTNNGSNRIPVPSPSLISSSFEPSSIARWVNAIWFSSLMLSLCAACVAMLAKQWLQAYIMDRSGRVELHARQRHIRYSGLVKWRVSEIISTLPVLLHVAFGLFFLGLDMLLWSVNKPIGCLLVAFTALVMGFYVFTTIAPLFDLTCPFKTPFSLTLRTQTRWTFCYAFALRDYIRALFIAIWSRTSRPAFQFEETPLSIADMERTEIDRSRHVLDVGIIEWLVATSHDCEVVDTALRSISSLRPDFNATPRLRDSGAIQLLADRLDPPPMRDTTLGAATAFRCHAANSIPYLASMFCSLRHCTLNDIAPLLSRFHWRAWIVSLGDFALEQLVSDGWDLEALALYLCASTQCDRAQGQGANREFGIMVQLLSRHASGEAELSSFTVWALVDSIALWGAEFRDSSISLTRPAVVACLLRLLSLPSPLGDPVTRAIGVALGVFALDFRRGEIARYMDEEKRREDVLILLLRGVVEIMDANPDDPASRYSLGKNDFEVGGTVLCELLMENNVSSWPTGAASALTLVLGFSKTESLTCRVLQALRRLHSFDSQPIVPNLSAAILPLLETSATQPVQVKATQVVGELMRWREHRTAMLEQGGVCSLIQNLESTCGELSNASSSVLVGLARDHQAQRIMLARGLAEALTNFFASGSATQQNLACWSWVFVRSSWVEGTGSSDGTNNLKKTFGGLVRALEDSICPREKCLQQNLLTPAHHRDLERVLQSLRWSLDVWYDEK